MFVRVLYVIFLGLLIAIFVGWTMITIFPVPRWEVVNPGVEQAPVPPMPPSSDELSLLSPDVKAQRVAKYEADLETYNKAQASRDQLQQEFQKKVDQQAVTVSLISMLIAVALTAIGLWYSGKLQVITEGLLLGGIFTLIYCLGWTFANARQYAVLATGIGLVITIVIGYMKFVKPGMMPQPPTAGAPPK